MGTRPHQIVYLILYEVSFLSFMSILVGTLIGVILNSTLAQQGVPLPETFTYGGIEFTKMYTTVNMRSILLPATTVLVTAAIVSVFPGLKAARNDPAKSMRTH
jgi:ABC-type antimicrobial peptide transport system permease subunit